MKPGDIVVCKYDKNLYTGGKLGDLRDSGVPFRGVGVILSVEVTPVRYGTSWYRILSPDGIGWVHEGWVRRVEE